MSKYSRTSSTPIWALLPTEKTLENFNPLVMAYSIMKTAVAPLPEIKSTPSGTNSGIGVVKTEV